MRRLLSFTRRYDVDLKESESNFNGTEVASVNKSHLPEEKDFNYIMRGQQQAFLNLTHDEFNQQKQNMIQNEKKIRIVIHVVLACYCFWMLAIICDEYFIASIHIFCQGMKTSQNNKMFLM